MAPLTPSKSKPDIRTFFGSPSQSQSQPKSKPSQSVSQNSSQGAKKQTAIEISEDEEPKSKSALMKSGTSTKTNTAKKRSPAKLASTLAMNVDSDSDSVPSKPAPKRKRPTALIDSDSDDDDEPVKPVKKKAAISPPKTKPKPTASAGAKPRQSKGTAKAPAKGKKVQNDDFTEEESSDEDDDDEFMDDEDDLIPSKSKPKPKPKAVAKKVPETKKPLPTKSAAKKDQPPSKPAPKASTFSPTAAPPQEPPKKKFNWAAAQAAKNAGPSAPGSKEVPNGAPNCLFPLAFVFTGELSAFAREEAVDLAKRFGGRVVGQPSSKTDYVVLGDAAGPSKLAAIKKHNLKTLNEDEFLNLIATRPSPDPSKLDEKTRKKMEKEKEEMKAAARELEMRERKEEKKAEGKGKGGGGAAGNGGKQSQGQLWTTRYAPQSLKEICGNKGQVEKLQRWLHDWQGSLKSNFKKPGKDGMNSSRAVLITGPPGIGKTTSAHMVAKLEGYTPIELNASDARSKKLVENATNVNNTSLDGWMGGKESTNAAGVHITDRTCLIMDEVDGMSAGDRGGVGALNALIKKTKVPIICIANDKGAQKLKPLLATTFGLSFRKPEAAAIRSRIMTVAFKEKMKIPANVIDQLVQGAQSDIRLVLNMLSTWKLSSDSMDFDEGKQMAQANEKYSIMSPFDICSKVMGPYLFSATSRESLGDKMDLYFQDHSFVPLFIQENYLKTQPSRIRNLDGPEKELKYLQLMEKASESLSDGDLVDALIHGPEQHWGLMPLHAVCSTVRPASFLFGQGSGYGGPNAMSFPQWLGQNSKQGKLSRQLTDVQVRMRLKVSGDKGEIRLNYIPALFPHIVKPLMTDGADAVEDVIGYMDEYYIAREDWDTVVELGVGDRKDESVLKKISTATKTSLTRKYNAQEHPIPFHKAVDIGKIPKKLDAGPAPDLEDAFIDDEPVDEEEEKPSTAEEDITKDKLIKETKRKGKGKAVASGKGKKLS